MNSFANAIFLTLLGCSVISAINSLPNPINDIDPTSPQNFCGSKLNQSMKKYCPFKNMILQRSGNAKRTPNHMLDQLWNAYSTEVVDDDVEFNSIGNKIAFNPYDYDMMQNFIYHKRNGNDNRIPITQLCCRQACTLEVLLEYCPSNYK